ncbi:MAG: HAMP domain-containing histidine kinase [Cellvibrionaceae bacterium]|nr:HAMP domain-containing histidine kinase [Cellvibrionaceae bacterium]
MDQQRALQEELDALRELTMSTMTASADLGFVLQFLKDSFTLPDHLALANTLSNALKNQGLEASICIRSFAEKIFVNHSGKSNPVEEQRIIGQMAGGRLVEDGNSLQVNYPAVSLLVHNFKFSDERRGQLRDALALLVEGVEARINSLALAEKEAEAQRSKREFFALMTHELRTPLNPIIGFSNRLEKKLGDNIDNKHRTAISSIKHNAENLLRLLNYFIDFSNLEIGEITLNKKNLNLEEVIDKALSITAPIVQGYNTEVIKKAAPNQIFCADPIRFTDIVVSLVCNAARISRNGKMTIYAEINACEQQLDFRVESCGTLSQDFDRQKVFENLVNRSTGCLQKSNELGIGLYLTKRLVELHHGSIELIADKNGDIFRVCLPLENEKKLHPIAENC